MPWKATSCMHTQPRSYTDLPVGQRLIVLPTPRLSSAFAVHCNHTQTVRGKRLMKALRKFWMAATLLLAASVACAGDYPDTINLFRHAGQSAYFFNHCY